MLEPIGNAFFPYREMPTDLTDCEVRRDPDYPWQITIIEPLSTDAPASAHPWCCYLATVIFYEHPMRLDHERREFVKHDEIVHRILNDDVFRLNGELIKASCGRVIWDGGRWVMTHRARPVEDLPAHLRGAA